MRKLFKATMFTVKGGLASSCAFGAYVCGTLVLQGGGPDNATKIVIGAVGVGLAGASAVLGKSAVTDLRDDL